ncbi:acyl-CoA dehydrogenase family protein [Aquabacterium sp. OR-4]|uniref:acyl-CoA dehydrogenase family protein n=1 Tax=Aquabacterium sp. OR-4 TaxID=2978127 RepID=UPI0021B3E78D|nr:acyl-CoA dehydrogenase family protein [Aquabacterium sp. OR-4]MDT7835766.1 acyl-CoA dehydrogenase family protein [Aquabacterium sp. OR-4]
MWTYQAPVADMLHVLVQVLDAPAQWATLPAHAELDADTAAQVLSEAGRFASQVLAPLNAGGDRVGCRWSPQGVVTPPGFREAWAAYVQGGWPALAAAPEDGGQGLPAALNMPLNEMIAAANHGWTMYPGLLHGACEVVRHDAVPELRARYLAPLVSGQWLATMCLTEPQAGSDLGQVRTRAELVAGQPAANGAPLRISGSKVFISGGEHDLSDNIVHLVLCRLPGAGAGSKGLSLALVPKILPDGQRNAVHCDGIEHKMGIHGSATCQMRFEQAEGWLIGEPHRGLAAMFRMMNSARLHVAMQGLGHLEAATQNAWRYAAGRVQMRAPSQPPGASPEQGGDPIAWHPAMRRLLLGLRARTDAARVVALRCAMLLDEAAQHPDATRRAAAAGQVAILTPVAKAFFTELGHRGADDALQAWGGYGFVAEYGIEQTVRDSRIAMIYEGTNEIQAIDLVLRKLLDDGGQRAGVLIDELAAEAVLCRTDAALQPFAEALDAQLDAWRQALAALLTGRDGDAEYPLRVADDMLAGVGHALLAWAWARIARCSANPARAPAPGGRSAQDWLDAARHGIDWLLPQAQVHWARVGRRGAVLPHLARVAV